MSCNISHVSSHVIACDMSCHILHVMSYIKLHVTYNIISHIACCVTYHMSCHISHVMSHITYHVNYHRSCNISYVVSHITCYVHTTCLPDRKASHPPPTTHVWFDVNYTTQVKKNHQKLPECEVKM